MKYDLILKGTVGYWDFNSDQVDNLLAAKDGQEVNVLIDSLGGSLSEGLSISSAFRNHGKVHVHFRGMNASAATVAAMGAARVTMDKSAMFLVHKVSYLVLEWDLLNADALRAKAGDYMKQATDLEKMDLNIAMLYADRCKKDYKELLALMKEDKWLTSQEAVEWGFVDEATGEGKAVRLTASVATAMASEGIPVPQNLPIEADSFFVRLEQLFKKMFNKDNAGETGEPTALQAKDAGGDDRAPSNNQTNQNTNPMKKIFALIASVIGLAIAEMEADEQGRFALSEEQMDALEKHLKEMQDQAAEAQATIAELQEKNQAQAATIAALQQQPEPEPEPVKNTGGEPVRDRDEYADLYAAVEEARKMNDMLS